MSEMKRLLELQRDCPHKEWSRWENIGTKEPDTEWHECLNCRKVELRDIKNGY